MEKKNNILVFGSYGYTGKLIVEELKKMSLPVILAGRNEDQLKIQKQESGFDYRVVDLAQLTQALGDIRIIIHCAGPFIHTAKKVIEACLETGTHYIDITGEFQVFDLLQNYDEQGKGKGITILPGAGFDVVPSDCLANHLKKLLPDATHLKLAFANVKGGLSRGTAKTGVENLGSGSLIRVNGKLERIAAGSKVMTVDFPDFTTEAVAIPWGDISTAYFSTGIPNIEVYLAAKPKLIRLMKLSHTLSFIFNLRVVKNWLQRKIDKRPPGPSPEKRKKSKSIFWGNVRNKEGNERTSILQTSDGYTLTAQTAALIASKVFAGQYKTGFQTPAMAYGPDLILEIKSTVRTDVV